MYKTDNIGKSNAATIIKESGIIHWKEEVDYHASQLTRSSQAVLENGIRGKRVEMIGSR